MSEIRCGDCVFCEKDDGFPYCLIKDLFTEVSLDRQCDEKDKNGDFQFSRVDKVK